MDADRSKAAGGQYTLADLNAHYDISLPGTYVVQFWIKIPEQFGGGEIRSNILTFNIKPR